MTHPVKVKCEVCGKVTTGRPAANGAPCLWPIKHKRFGGAEVCPGSRCEAEEEGGE